MNESFKLEEVKPTMTIAEALELGILDYCEQCKGVSPLGELNKQGICIECLDYNQS